MSSGLPIDSHNSSWDLVGSYFFYSDVIDYIDPYDSDSDSSSSWEK